MNIYGVVRRNKNLSQKQLAEILDIHPVTVGKIESGDRVPSAKLRVRIAEALGVSEKLLRHGIRFETNLSGR